MSPRSEVVIGIASALFALALPVLFISANVRVLVGSKQTYDYDWWRNGVEVTTGLSRQQLDDVGTQFRDYFSNREPYLLLTAEVAGQQERLLNEREVLHMHDVRELVQRIMAAEWIAGAIALGYVAGGFVLLRARFWSILQRAITLSAIVAGVAAGIVGVAAAIDFDTTFTIFHEISFSNDYWKLAYRDSLIRMWPEPFWFEATFAIVIMTTLEFAVALACVRWFRRSFERRRGGLGSSSEVQRS